MAEAEQRAAILGEGFVQFMAAVASSIWPLPGLPKEGSLHLALDQVFTRQLLNFSGALCTTHNCLKHSPETLAVLRPALPSLNARARLCSAHGQPVNQPVQPR